MRKVGSRELKNRLGRYLARVRKGEAILITDRGEPVARLLPPEPAAKLCQPSLEEKLRELAAAGYLRLGRRPFPDFKPIRVRGKRLSRIILEERR